MSKITFTPVLRKKLSTDKYGIIKIRITENRASNYSSLKEPLKEIYWNAKKNEIRLNYEEIERNRLNELIENKIKELKAIHKVTGDSKKTAVNSKTSFMDYLNLELKYLEERGKIGTYKRYKSLYYHLEKFIGAKADLLFSEINTLLIRDFETYLLKQVTQSGTLMKKNTSINYIKCFKRLYTSAERLNIYTSMTNPFSLFIGKREPVLKKSLTKVEVEHIAKREFNKEAEIELFHTQKYFLFQIFCQGLGVSDLLTLRWSNIDKEGRIKFYRFKTKRLQSILLNDRLLPILKEYMQTDCSHIVNQKYNIKIGEERLNMTLAEFKKHYDTVCKKHIHELLEKGVFPKEVEILKKLLMDITFKVSANLLMAIIAYSKEHPSEFIFPFLKNADFASVIFDQNTRLSKYQYNQIQSKEAIYNKSLKLLQRVFDIKTTITSHLQRHTYTSMMLDITDDIYAISKSLGHSKISITEHYISDFNTDKVDNPNIDFVNSFSMI